MVTATTTVRTIQASASNAAGATTNGTAVDLRTTFGGNMMARVTNGASGPTVGCDIIIQVSTDNAAWRELFRGTASDVGSVASDFPYPVTPGWQYLRVVFSGNTGQAVTVEAYFHEFTSIG